MRHIARCAGSRDEKSAQGRSPQGGRGHKVGRITAVQAKHPGNHKSRRQQATQKKASCAPKAHNSTAHGTGNKDECTQRPQGKIAYKPAKARQQGQQGQSRTWQRKQHKLHIQQARPPFGTQQVAAHMRQEHKGHARAEHGGGLHKAYMPGTVSRYTHNGLSKGRTHIQGRPYAPLPLFGKPA